MEVESCALKLLDARNITLENFFNHTRDSFSEILQTHQIPLQHLKSVFKSAYQSDLEWGDFEEGFQMPRKLVSMLREKFCVGESHISKVEVSKYDSSCKFLIKLKDGAEVEMVLMPEASRITLCVSSQVGCIRRCSFCHTGRMGLIRNLEVGEIVEQVYLANRWIQENDEWARALPTEAGKRVTNIVFMGMGEPMDNVSAVIHSIDIMTDHFGLSIAPKKILVSSSGHLDGLDRLLEKRSDTFIAMSLHAPTQRTRSQLMPINKQWPLEDVINWIKRYNERYRKEVFIQYLLISGINDTPSQAEELCRVLQGLDVKVNLIPFNDVEPSQFESPTPTSLKEFSRVIHGSGIRCTTRFSKGQDINAACGQLVKTQK